jgi:hypothetical protein
MVDCRTLRRFSGSILWLKALASIFNRFVYLFDDFGMQVFTAVEGHGHP